MRPRPWGTVDHLRSDEAMLGYLEAVFEDGDPELIAAALNDFGQARGLTPDGRPRAGNVPGTKNASLPEVTRRRCPPHRYR